MDRFKVLAQRGDFVMNDNFEEIGDFGPKNGFFKKFPSTWVIKIDFLVKKKFWQQAEFLWNWDRSEILSMGN